MWGGRSGGILVRAAQTCRPAMIHEEIRTLLEAPPVGEDAPSIDAVEHTLTAGYARALALEAERWRLERRLDAVVDLQLHQDVRDVVLDRLRADVQLGGDHRVVLAVRDQLQDLDLAVRELRADRSLDLGLGARGADPAQDLRGDRR